MGKAKNIRLEFIDKMSAGKFVKKNHYSGKFTQNSKIHIGVFYEGKLAGVMQYGPPIDKRRMIGLVQGTRWNGLLELNRMAFDDIAPKNSESRALAISFKMIHKHYPFVKWIVSFSDACQCGDGTIYRASGFILTGIKVNKTMRRLPNGEVISDLSFNLKADKKYKGYEKKDSKPLIGYQIRYVKFLDDSYRKRLTVPEIPFSKIDEIGASMYKGKKVERASRIKTAIS